MRLVCVKRARALFVCKRRPSSALLKLRWLSLALFALTLSPLVSCDRQARPLAEAQHTRASAPVVPPSSAQRNAIKREPVEPILITNAPQPEPVAVESDMISSADVIPGGALLTRFSVRALASRWSEQEMLKVGPIPDYAPVRAVYYHTQLGGLAPETALSFEVLLSGVAEVDDYDPGEQEEGSEEFIEDTMLLWMRDYHPIYVRRPTGDLQAIHYLAHNPNRARYLLRGAPRVDEVAQLQLIHENGNLIVAGEWVFVSERLLEDNSEAESDAHLIEGGYLPRGRAEIIAMLSERLYVPPEKIIVLPTMPHEATGHVDLYLMALNAHQVIIPKVVMPLEHFSQDPVEQQIARDVKEFLDERAQQVAKLGLEVIRLPQLPPLYLPALDEPEGNFDVVFYTPTNGLLVNKGAEQLVLLPHFEAEALRPELKEMSEAYERYWREAFLAFGWPPYMVNSTLLARYLGLIHCVTATTPKLPLRDEWRSLKGLPKLSPHPHVKTRESVVSASRSKRPSVLSSRVASQTLGAEDPTQAPSQPAQAPAQPVAPPSTQPTQAPAQPAQPAQAPAQPSAPMSDH